MACNFAILVYLHSSHQASFLPQLLLLKILKVCYLPSTTQKTANVRDYLVNVVEHLAAKEPGCSFAIADQTELKVV